MTLRRGTRVLRLIPVPSPAPPPTRLLGHVRPGDRPFVLLSGKGDPRLSRWSYGALETAGTLSSFASAHRAVIPRGSGAPLSADRASSLETRSASGAPSWLPFAEGDALPPFTGGAVGYLSYDVGWAFAPKPRAPRPDPLGMPQEHFSRVDALYARNEETGEGMVLFEATEEAEARGARLREALARKSPPLHGGVRGRLEPKVSRSAHLARIRQALEEIRSGEIYQVNLSHPLEAELEGSPAAVLERMRPAAPPFAAYLQVDDDAHILSASPECFLDLEPSGRIRTYPIKGTRPRAPLALDDARLSHALGEDPKEQAEHRMIVDLLRNDLGRVAQGGTVTVERLAYIESFPTIHHLTSRIRADLRLHVTPEDFLRAVFPGGSITGAPKLRAMEVIDRLEGEARGVATGSLLFIDHGGGLRASIAIRTAQIRGGRLRFGVGGGIVADSDPDREWDETLLKAEALGAVLGDPRR